MSNTPEPRPSVQVPTAGRRVLALLGEAGHESYIAGGAVRDLMRGQPLVDIDIATAATPDEVLSVMAEADVATWDVGREFGTIGVWLDQMTIEVTTFRAESYEPGNRHPQVSWSASASEDMRRRDLTINSMFMGLDGEIVDLFGGTEDLEAGLIRTTSDADRTFLDDPLRIVRAARFSAALDFEIDPATAASARRHNRTLQQVSGERVLAEIHKAFTAGKAPGFCARCRELGIADLVFPGLDHEEVTKEHPTAAWVQLISELPSSERSRRLAGLTCSKRHIRCVTRAADLVDLIRGLDAPITVEDQVSVIHRTRRLEAEEIAAGLEVAEADWADELVADSDSWRRGSIGVDGNDLKAVGLAGPEIGRRLAELERDWISERLSP